MTKQIKHPRTKEVDAFEDANVEIPQPTAEQLEITQAIEIVNRANEASVLMQVLCNTLGLESQKTTHVEFVTKFTELQQRSIEAQKTLTEKFVTAPVPEKMRKNAKMKYQ